MAMRANPLKKPEVDRYGQLSVRSSEVCLRCFDALCWVD